MISLFLFLITLSFVVVLTKCLDTIDYYKEQEKIRIEKEATTQVYLDSLRSEVKVLKAIINERGGP